MPGHWDSCVPYDTLLFIAWPAALIVSYSRLTVLAPEMRLISDSSSVQGTRRQAPRGLLNAHPAGILPRHLRHFMHMIVAASRSLSRED